MPEVTVRLATVEDIDSLALLLDHTSMGHGLAADERQRSGLEMMLNNGRGRILAAQAADGTVVGMCSGQLTVSRADGDPAVLIEDIVVHEDWRGQGIGARLMDGINDWARTDRAARLHILADQIIPPMPTINRDRGWEAPHEA